MRLWNLLPQLKEPRSVHVLALEGSRGRTGAGITLHRTNFLPHRHIRRLNGLPLTSPERTLADCARLLDGRRLERALDEALARSVTSLTKLRELVEAHPRRHRQLRELMADRERPTVTKEEAEERFLQLIRAAGLPEPHTQVMLYEQSVDAYWPEAHFAVEVDSMQWHANKSKFERDRLKEQILRDNGITLTRATWDQITSRPLQLMVHIARQIGVDRARAA